MAIRELIPRRLGLRRMEDENLPWRSIRDEIDSLHREMDRLFTDLWQQSGDGSSLLPESLWAGGRWPSIDEAEDDDSYRITIELPGLDADDVDVSLADGVLTIRGEKKQEAEDKNRNFHRRERAYGSFRRMLAVPRDVDESAIKASFKKGVLSIELPKSEEARKSARRIEVTTG